MINRLHALFHRPETGWDPVPRHHAEQYANSEYQLGVNAELLDDLERTLGGLNGKTVLDLGGGPGHYSLAFAQRGAHVTWFDISAAYREIAARKCAEAGVQVEFKVGYLDQAGKLTAREYDLVFNRVCWYYAFSDWSFARMVYRLTARGGVAYIDTHHSDAARGTQSTASRMKTWINDHLYLKIGHPFPPRGRVAQLFLRYPLQQLCVDYSSPGNDRITFIKPAVD